MTALIDTIMLTALIGGALTAAIAVAHWIGFADWFMNLTLRNTPTRIRPPRANETGADLHLADPYFHSTGAFRLRLHELRRRSAAEKTGPGVDRNAEALTGKEITHARSNR